MKFLQLVSFIFCFSVSVTSIADIAPRSEYNYPKIDFEKSLEFSKKLAKANNITIDEFFHTKDYSVQRTYARNYMKIHGIELQQPKIIVHPKCDLNNPTFGTWDDLQSEIAQTFHEKYPLVMEKPVDANGHFLPIELCFRAKELIPELKDK